MADDLHTLFRLYRAELQRLAYRRTGDHDVAADVVQDAFLRYACMGCGDRPAAVENPRFFLWRVVVNLIADLGRTKLRRGIHDNIDDMADTLSDNRPTPEQVLEARQRLKRLRRALDELSPPCRAALLLNRLEGLTHAQVAVRLGVSPSMVSKHIMRALRHCARRLDGG